MASRATAGRQKMTTESDEFVRLADPFRRELLVHCYRMLGSVDDAEDLVQETYLRAWRAYDDFEGRSSLRTWLYRIATLACLTALEHRSRRVLPSALVPATGDPAAPMRRPDRDEAFVEPLPDVLARTDTADPATIVESRDEMRLAWTVAVQNLSAKQRAVLILRDVLAWRASEVAELLDCSTAAVNSALQRARSQMQRLGDEPESTAGPRPQAGHEQLEAYVSAFENADVAKLVKLLRHDVVLEMPPFLNWFSGRDPVVRFLAARCTGGGIRMLPTAANGQPAVIAYFPEEDRPGDLLHARTLHVLTTTESGVSRIVAYRDKAVVSRFGLPATLSALARQA
ncbi:MAG: sigma-70 family RNA polymerase sigma factor [Actinomycetota bacterium]|nr:sigma-70 family RNA polymerase sigma factor [Actinomycetota bacterium]